MKVSPSTKTNHLSQYYSNSEKYDSDVQAHKHAIYDSMSISEFHSYFCEFSRVNDLGNGLTTYKKRSKMNFPDIRRAYGYECE